MIVIIDYEMGNLKSVSNALNHLCVENKISDNPYDIKSADGLILPGVGSFPDAMKIIKEKGLYNVINEEVKKGKMLLGICLGMQVLFEKSYEGKETEGFGFLKGSIVKMHSDKGNNIKIPHIGWNNIKITNKHKILNGIEEDSFFYYVHSYCASNYDEKDLVSYSIHGINKIPGIVIHKNVIGIQFHPEKSGECGLKILENFGEMI